MVLKGEHTPETRLLPPHNFQSKVTTSRCTKHTAIYEGGGVKVVKKSALLYVHDSSLE